ncbi:MAG: polyribonucleotide nucleotidyltransferase [Candidatus Taylorbacteria bacterium RIFCSPHIGHO2_02_FULL_46_13]|uniref:Polyribonucleotide nucleotidyltransferase n=1 Tax=Candidatus Taylorbacteria bacterium RIFCSPHIGHO2_02_FULL_46_13 TaxID=1802312 RepID=A0A1G2MTV4_9BACT|nr:MAG: polyribonucleotide nucleotidyltransferase [Candidatus Taylorbacteria bacterium RIFCSPHIGHO2_02_FULL_46_13]
MTKKEFSVEIGGKTLIAQFTDLAEQATGSCIVKYGNTTVLATAVMSHAERDGDWFPLTVDYEERFYAAGKILGSRFIRREGRPTEEAVLSGRIVDRTIRPLFDNRMRNEVQVVVTVLSIAEDDPDMLGVIASSLALATSEIPWNGPVSAVRLGKRKGDNNFIINPSYTDRNAEDADLDLLMCGTDGLVNMIEVGSKEVSESVLVSGLEEGLTIIEKLQKFQAQIVKEIGNAKKKMEFPETPKEVKELFAEMITPKFFDAIFKGPGKHAISIIKDEWMNKFAEKYPDMDKTFADTYFEEELNNLVHTEAIENGRRADGRGLDELRPLYAQAGGVSPIIHGSGIFYRGGTHVFSALTLGGPGESMVVDGMEVQGKKRFMHHYNFPPFSVGETGRMGGMNRRMIGHGALAEKALTAVLPPKETFPYTIRIVSEAFASNGSTSMASVCGSALALMDAGVPITRAVAGIASGLMIESPKKYKVLTDIQGPEDHHGDMDFKVAGTSVGVTAVQMDVKIAGVSVHILTEALEKAKSARLRILEVMEKELAAPRPDISPNAPKILSIKIKVDQIGLVIGGGGKTINGIMEKTGAEIDIEDDGMVFVTGKNGAAEAALEIIAGMTREYLPGERFDGEVTRLMDFGAFVKIGYNAEGLVHISELAPWRVNKVTDLVKEGDIVPVMVREVDEKGRLNLSIKAANPTFFKRPAGATDSEGGGDRRSPRPPHHKRY